MIKVGLSGSILIEAGGMFPGYPRTYVNHDYVNSITKAGAVPIVLPLVDSAAMAKVQVSSIDALVLTGGYDVHPRLYGEEPDLKLGETMYERDCFERELIWAAEARRIPILGICRGLQLLNVVHGGSLYQDLSAYPKPTLRHWQITNPQELTHQVKLDETSKLADIFQTTSFYVNSFHHQIIKEVATDFKVVAQSVDGVIEAIEHVNYPFELAVQWHPEMLHRDNLQLQLFKALVVAAKQR